MSRDIEGCVGGSGQCNKVDRSGPIRLLQRLPVPPQGWHTIIMNFADPFTASAEGKCGMIEVFLDRLSKRAHIVPSESTDIAPDTMILQ